MANKWHTKASCDGNKFRSSEIICFVDLTDLPLFPPSVIYKIANYDFSASIETQTNVIGDEKWPWKRVSIGCRSSWRTKALGQTSNIPTVGGATGNLAFLPSNSTLTIDWRHTPIDDAFCVDTAHCCQVLSLTDCRPIPEEDSNCVYFINMRTKSSLIESPEREEGQFLRVFSRFKIDVVLLHTLWCIAITQGPNEEQLLNNLHLVELASF